MDKIAKAILKEVLPAEKDVAPRAASARAGGKKTALHLDHWTSAVLLERAAYLHKLARQGDGSASETLKEYPRHCTMLSFRSRDGEAEAHENFADVFYVLEGRATLVTGGTVVGARFTKPGETRGTSIEGGVRQELRAGDVAHVPAGLPHQMLVAGEQTVTCLVLKVEENP
ncbi:MAG TPA: cupin domain-containing protein [Terracidiphilus sp.]|jgi:mannose-6-phosphate isomerase-like protein (cupin superfamily)